MDRISWIDTAKALGIFLVLLGHYQVDSRFILWIYSFHMPLFFFISGVLFDPAKYPVLRRLYARRIRTLVVPYFFFAAFWYLFWLVVFYKGPIDLLFLRMSLFGVFYGTGIEFLGVPLNYALWFLLCLFVTEIIFWELHHHFRKEYMPLALSGLAILGFSISIAGLPRLCWSAEVALTGVVFYGSGFLLKDFIERWMQNKYFLLTLGAFFVLNILGGMLNGRVDMNANHYGNLILFYLASFSGIFFLIGLSRLLPGNKLFEFVGRHTLVIIGLSGVPYFILGIANDSLKILPSITSPIPIATAILYTSLQILLLIPVMRFLNKYLPFVIGRQ